MQAGKSTPAVAPMALRAARDALPDFAHPKRPKKFTQPQLVGCLIVNAAATVEACGHRLPWAWRCAAADFASRREVQVSKQCRWGPQDRLEVPREDFVSWVLDYVYVCVYVAGAAGPAGKCASQPRS